MYVGSCVKSFGEVEKEYVYLLKVVHGGSPIIDKLGLTGEPCLEWRIMLLALRCFHMWLNLVRTICSITIHTINVKEIGMFLMGLLLLPFLYIGMTRAVFQAFGSLPVVCDCWNIC